MAATGFVSFGQQPQATSNQGFSLGQPPQQPSNQGFSFGGASNQVATPSVAAVAPIPQSTGFGFATPFGNTPSTSLATGVGGGISFGGLLAPQPTNTSVTSFSQPLSILSSKPTAAPSLLGAPPTTSSSIFNLPSTTGATPALNLGGLTGSTSLLGPPPASSAITSSAPSEPTPGAPVKSATVPLDLSVGIEDFKKFLSEESRYADSISLLSVEPLIKVGERVEALKGMLSLVEGNNQRDMIAVQKVKVETQQELRNGDLAQRTKDFSPSSSSSSSSFYANLESGPNNYFLEMIDFCEMTLLSCAEQLLYLERLKDSNTSQMKPSGRDLYASMVKTHDYLIAVTAELYDTHEALKVLKEEYLSYRSRYHGDRTNIFDGGSVVRGAESRRGGPTSILGPSPFTRRDTSLAGVMSALQSTGRSGSLFGNAGSSLLGTSGLFGSSTTGLLGNNPGGFGSSSTLLSTTGQPIKLGLPPARAKKGRR